MDIPNGDYGKERVRGRTRLPFVAAPPANSFSGQCQRACVIRPGRYRRETAAGHTAFVEVICSSTGRYACVLYDTRITIPCRKTVGTYWAAILVLTPIAHGTFGTLGPHERWLTNIAVIAGPIYRADVTSCASPAICALVAVFTD